MPLTLRPKNSILDVILSSLLAGNTVTDVSQISVVRQLCEAVAATQADLDYDLYSVLTSFYLQTAEGEDLSIRGRDYGLTRDAGQGASGDVTLTRAPLWVDDILLPSPQVVQATLSDGTIVVYRSLGDSVLAPCGRSVSGQAPAPAITGGVNDQLSINLDGDGVRGLTLGTQTSPAAIAAQIQAIMRSLVATNPSRQTAYDDFRCDANLTTPGAYTLRSGTTGPSSSVVVTGGTTNDASAALKLGGTQGGLEQVGQDTLSLPVLCDTIGVLGNVGAGQINVYNSQVQGIDTVANPLMFSNGREVASDDAYRQDIRAYLLSLGRGTQDAITRAVAQTEDATGARVVMSSQVVGGTGTVQAFICDGRSLTVGAQPDVVQAVQDELDGLGQEPGGWLPSGVYGGVVPSPIFTVNVDVAVTVGPTPDLVRAQSALTNAIHVMLYQWPVGAALSYSQLTVKINETVAEVIGNTFTQPLQFAQVPPALVGGGIGLKLMPGAIRVEVTRA